jgi:chitinase
LLELWASSGISKSKLIAGIPLYGRGWLLESADEHDLGAAAAARVFADIQIKEPGVWPYSAICGRIVSDEAREVYDEEIGASYAFTNTWWIGYNDERTIKTKVRKRSIPFIPHFLFGPRKIPAFFF